MSLALNSSTMPHFASLHSIDSQNLEHTRRKNLIEFQKLMEIARKKNVDVSQQASNFQQILAERHITYNAHQFLLYENTMLEKYNSEMGRKIAQHVLFHEDKENSNSNRCESKWKQCSLEFQNLVKIAREKGVDVSQEARKVQQLLDNCPTSRESHQFKIIRMAHQIKMMRKYNREIKSKISFYLRQWTKKVSEFQRLIRTARVHQIDINENQKTILEVFPDLPLPGVAPQTRPLKKVCEIEMLRNYNQEMGYRIGLQLRHFVFNGYREGLFNLDGNSEYKWKKQMSEYQKLLEIAREKKVDITEQRHKIQQILLDRPDLNDSHQFKPMRVFYEAKMLRKYNREIGRKIAQHGLYHANREVLQGRLNDDLTDVHYDFRKWVSRARGKGIEVKDIVAEMQLVADDLPDSHQSNQISTVRSLYEIRMCKILCIRIMRRLAEFEIQKVVQVAKNDPTLQEHKGFIHQHERFLLSHLPEELSPLTIEQAAAKYYFVMEELEKMREKLSKDALMS